jgi:hypothetical protein
LSLASKKGDTVGGRINNYKGVREFLKPVISSSVYPWYRVREIQMDEWDER